MQQFNDGIEIVFHRITTGHFEINNSEFFISRPAGNKIPSFQSQLINQFFEGVELFSPQERIMITGNTNNTLFVKGEFMSQNFKSPVNNF